jgi:hypothetical protein
MEYASCAAANGRYYTATCPLGATEDAPGSVIFDKGTPFETTRPMPYGGHDVHVGVNGIGRRAVIAKMWTGGRALVVNDTGQSRDLGAVNGDQAIWIVGRTDDSFDVYFVSDGATQLRHYAVAGDLSSHARLDDIPVPADIPGTSQGLTGIDAGVVLWADQNRQAHLPGNVTLQNPVLAGGWLAGLSWRADGVDAYRPSAGLARVFSGAVPVPVQIASLGDGTAMVAVSGAKATFVHSSAFDFQWAPPPTPTPTPPPPTPPPSPQQPHQEPHVEISNREITEVVSQAKRQLESQGYVFKTVEQVGPDAVNFDDRDRKRAMMVTLLAAKELQRRYPTAGIGLEHYAGGSGVRVGDESYSFDIILLSKEGPSSDVLGAGVIPTSQIEEDPKYIPDWRRDWRPPVDFVMLMAPDVVAEPATPPPTAPPVPAPTPAPAPATKCLFSDAGVREIAASQLTIIEAFMSLSRQITDLKQQIADRPQVPAPVTTPVNYVATIFGQRVVFKPEVK